jgi:hypothetical protein
VTFAPVYVYESSIQEYALHVYALNTTTSGSNHELVEWQSDQGTWVTPLVGGSPIYVVGVAADNVTGAFWGWTSSGAVYTNETGTDVEDWTSGFTSSAAAESTIYRTSSTTNCTGSSTAPAGPCLESYDATMGWPDGTWPDVGQNAGAEQVTLDPTNTILGPYVIDSSGSAWHLNGSTWNRLGSTSSGNSECGGGTLVFVQIATKFGWVFGMTAQGTVWWLPFLGTCWTNVGGSTSGFAASIATDNGTTAAVWALTQDGAVLAAD